MFEAFVITYLVTMFFVIMFILYLVWATYDRVMTMLDKLTEDKDTDKDKVITKFPQAHLVLSTEGRFRVQQGTMILSLWQPTEQLAWSQARRSNP